MRGLFITLEGGEGAGKTSLIQRLLPFLQSQGLEVITTREPGGCKLSEKIRNLLLDEDLSCPIYPKAELLLYLASRMQHLEEKILPALERGIWVLCDRFNDSSLAYQGYARGLGVEDIQKLTELLFEKSSPDLTLYLDVDPQIGLSRSSKLTDNQQHDRMEKEALSFHQKVREGYQMLLKKYPERFFSLDASISLEATFEQAKALIQAHAAKV